MTSGQHAEPPPAKRRGPKPAISDQALLVAIEADLEDTRSLSNRAAIRVAKNRSQMQTPPRFVCHAKAASHRAIDILLNMVKIGQRLPYTYLRTIYQRGRRKKPITNADTAKVCVPRQSRQPSSHRHTPEHGEDRAAPSLHLSAFYQRGRLLNLAKIFAGPDTQDAVCEKYRKRLPRRVRKTATCITGTELPYKRY